VGFLDELFEFDVGGWWNCAEMYCAMGIEAKILGEVELLTPDLRDHPNVGGVSGPGR